MQVKNLSLSGLKLLVPQVFADERGYFLETFKSSEYEKLGIDPSFTQDNHSFSKQGVIRGMHFQTGVGQAKLVRVVSGKIYDVAVDIRPESKTFMQWEGVYLDGEKHEQLYIPKGYAHGFCVLSPTAHVLYKVSSEYYPEMEKGFRYDDPQIGITWPVALPILSRRDRDNPAFKELQ